MKKILTVVGARPQFIKIGPVSKALSDVKVFSEVVVHTGQHFDENMSQLFFQQLDLPTPSYNLGLGGGTHAHQTAQMLLSLEHVFVEEKPDLLLVYGDTNSTLSAALVAAKMHIPVAHVEAGLRSFNKHMPEEINRILTDHMSSLLFAPSEIAKRNLCSEGFEKDKIYLTGDVMFDAVAAHLPSSISNKELLPSLSLKNGDYALLTLHRAENTDCDKRLNALIDELLKLSKLIKIVFPLHPRTRLALERVGRLDQVSASCVLIPPAGYLENLQFIKSAAIVLTDSGGMQKEAFFLQTPCVTLREETEWLETIEIGANSLYSPESSSLITCVERQLAHFKASNAEPYGSGDSSVKIVQYIKNFLKV